MEGTASLHRNVLTQEREGMELARHGKLAMQNTFYCQVYSPVLLLPHPQRD